MRFLARLASCERGATAIEYGLILAAIAIVIIGALTNLGTSVTGSYQSVADGFNSAR